MDTPNAMNDELQSFRISLLSTCQGLFESDKYCGHCHPIMAAYHTKTSELYISSPWARVLPKEEAVVSIQGERRADKEKERGNGRTHLMLRSQRL